MKTGGSISSLRSFCLASATHPLLIVLLNLGAFSSTEAFRTKLLLCKNSHLRSVTNLCIWVNWVAQYLEKTYSLSFDRVKHPFDEERRSLLWWTHFHSCINLHSWIIMSDIFSLGLILKSCYLVLFTYPATLEESVSLLKQSTWDNVVGQMEILQDERSLPDGEGGRGVGGYLG